jgi:beta-galactosidase GanA
VSGHGTISEYVNHKCRCTECREAWRAYMTALRAKRSEWVRANGLPIGIAHGSSAYTNWGCRCDSCRSAVADLARRKARRTAA